MEVTNKSKRPLSVPLPGGKQLHLGPGKSGKLVPKDAEHPPVKKLIEDGDLVVIDKGRSKGTGSARGAPNSA